MFKAINGFTRSKILTHVRKEFKGVARNEERGICLYLTESGKKCVVGLFIPDGHEAQKYEGIANSLLIKYKDLKRKMPLNTKALTDFQMVHDSLEVDLPLKDQVEKLCEWVKNNVAA